MFVAVALPWLEERKRKLSQADATLVCCVCQFPTLLKDERFCEVIAEPFSKLLSKNPVEVGDLIFHLGAWRDKQEKTKLGRVRRLIEIALVQHPNEEFEQQLLWRIANENGIDVSDISPDYPRGRVGEIRDELERPEASIPLPAYEKIMDQLKAVVFVHSQMDDARKETRRLEGLAELASIMRAASRHPARAKPTAEKKRSKNTRKLNAT